MKCWKTLGSHNAFKFCVEYLFSAVLSLNSFLGYIVYFKAKRSAYGSYRDRRGRIWREWGQDLFSAVCADIDLSFIALKLVIIRIMIHKGNILWPSYLNTFFWRYLKYTSILDYYGSYFPVNDSEHWTWLNTCLSLQNYKGIFYHILLSKIFQSSHLQCCKFLTGLKNACL